MVVFVDRSASYCAPRVLFEVPNALGWRCHFGVPLAPDAADVGSAKAAAEAAATAAGVALAGPLLEEGLMLFTFKNVDDGPMRVRVFEVDVAREQNVGTFYDFARVPYERMWADDGVWLPDLLQGDGRFEGHFLFDGGPGGGSPLVTHNYHDASPRLWPDGPRMSDDPRVPSHYTPREYVPGRLDWGNAQKPEWGLEEERNPPT